MASSITVDKIAATDGVLGAWMFRNDAIHFVVPDDLALTFKLALNAVAVLGSCRLIYGGKDGATVFVERFEEVDVTIIVAVRTGHKAVKSVRRLMRSAAGLPRDKKKVDA